MELKNSTITVILPDDLEWIDRYEWTQVKEKVEVTLNGNLVIQTATQIKGRPITLKGGADYGWIDRDTIAALQQLADAGENMTLTFADNTSYNVRFRYEQGAFSASPILPNLEYYNNVIIRLIEV
jgi:hypothetical protein